MTFVVAWMCNFERTIVQLANHPLYTRQFWATAALENRFKYYPERLVELYQSQPHFNGWRDVSLRRNEIHWPSGFCAFSSCLLRPWGTGEGYLTEMAAVLTLIRGYTLEPVLRSPIVLSLSNGIGEFILLIWQFICCQRGSIVLW